MELFCLIATHKTFSVKNMCSVIISIQKFENTINSINSTHNLLILFKYQKEHTCELNITSTNYHKKGLNYKYT